MGNKYVKLICAILAILLVSLSQFHDMKEYYQTELPFDELEEYKRNTQDTKGPKEIDLNLLVGQKKSKLDTMKYSEKELKILAEFENEELRGTTDTSVYVQNDVTDTEITEAFLQESDQLVTEVTGDNSTSVNIKLNAVASVLMDADTQRVLYGKNEEKELAMASTTKIMTCIVALENAKFDDIVTVSKYAASMPDVQLNMKAGEQFYLVDLLYSLMLESHNDTAVAIAEAVGGSVEGFADMMNAKAQELGCTHTNFVTPNGLDAQGHYTTATELGKIASYAIRNEDFITITNAASHTFNELTNNKQYMVSNKNRFLYLMEGAIGVKTGFTNNAGYCFVGAIRRDARTFVSVVLGSGWPPHKQYKWNDTMALMNYGINNYDKKIIMNQEIDFPDLYLENGQCCKVPVSAVADLSALIHRDETVKALLNLPYLMEAPVKTGDKVGELQFYIDDTLFATVPVTAKADVSEIDFAFCKDKVLNGFFGRY